MILIIGQPKSGKTTFMKYLQTYLPNRTLFEATFAHPEDIVIEIVNRGEKLIHHKEEYVDVQVDNSRDLDDLKFKAMKVAEAIKNGTLS